MTPRFSFLVPIKHCLVFLLFILRPKEVFLCISLYERMYGQSRDNQIILATGLRSRAFGLQELRY